MLLTVNSDQSVMIVDSYNHIGGGALISYAPQDNTRQLYYLFAHITVLTYLALGNWRFISNGLCSLSIFRTPLYFYHAL